ncbi:hypothetical protein BABINDRAFT_99084 [Babjeviella inositovora NRRL Y-12698]|uniref:Uncharacterized protein n=1 Tax=Babjeviella inositovora NRRL Y-12698 TaxID=984486 RepID=A0A1E3QIH9_9ASCO|nr:uncharacterized protein BABINDRAFT_99084 [Babjeviella inositovora NRRL Y-12698]ODQ77505.1 hypothetical protein BABINDRAFT_99084 [Babjeviella inositovora NRRL Y-12698]
MSWPDIYTMVSLKQGQICIFITTTLSISTPKCYIYIYYLSTQSVKPALTTPVFSSLTRSLLTTFDHQPHVGFNFPL